MNNIKYTIFSDFKFQSFQKGLKYFAMISQWHESDQLEASVGQADAEGGQCGRLSAEDAAYPGTVVLRWEMWW